MQIPRVLCYRFTIQELSLLHKSNVYTPLLSRTCNIVDATVATSHHTETQVSTLHSACVTLYTLVPKPPIPVAAQSKALAYWDYGFQSRREQGFLSLANVAAGRSLVQRSPTECGVSVCDLYILTIRRPRSE
jgi:hypothetical protein